MNEFIAYLQSKNHSQATQKEYLRNVNLFLNWYKVEPINCQKKDILNYLEHLQTHKKQENATRNNTLIALKHYFAFLHKTEQISQNPCLFLKLYGTKKRHLYKIYTTGELEQLYDDFYHTFIRNFNDNHNLSRPFGIPQNQEQQAFLSRQRNYVMFGILVFQGLATNELQKITLDDIDLNKAKITIQGSKKSNPRTLNLNASQIGFLINYIENIRPKFFKYCNPTQKLFFILPQISKTKTSSENLKNVFIGLKKQVGSIDQKFLQFMQIRASVITVWIKTTGLRKAQYLAGHKSITATEKYVINNLENLTQDLTKFNPF